MYGFADHHPHVSETMTQEDGHRIVQEAADRLGEQFESVVILASWSESDETEMVRAWSGNYFAAKGMVDSFNDFTNSGGATE